MATYADADDVTRILGLDYRLSGSTNPSPEYVEEHLLEAEEEVESFTRQAWRPKTVTYEYHDFPVSPYRRSTGIPVYLRRNPVRTIDTASGDKIELWTGTAWEDWAATKTEGRGGDYWLDYEKGILYLRTRPFFHFEKAIRVTYRYGHTTVPRDIQKATAMIAASMLLLNDDQSSIIVEGGEGRAVNLDSKVRILRGQAFKILDRHASPILIY